MKLQASYFSSEQKRCFGRRRDERGFRVDIAIKEALDELGEQERKAAFLKLLECFRTKTKLLRPTFTKGGMSWKGAVFIVMRLRNVAARHRFWWRPLEDWVPADGENIRRAFRSLAHHLFAVYEVPGFMDSVWDLPLQAEGFRQQSWYIRLGKGASLRSLNLPIQLTRRMEHYARQAPDDCSAMQALRYGETRALGGSEALARQISAGRLGSEERNNAFWRTVVRFLSAHSEVPLEHVGPIIEYIHANKFAGEKVLTVNGIQAHKAPWPEFSMEGRTPQSLLRLVSRWSLPDDAEDDTEKYSWERSGIAAYRFVEDRNGGGELDWSIVELLNSGALYSEGRALHHCVYAYTNKCRRGQSAIWSLRLRAGEEEKRLVTIEVDRRRQAIIQVRATCNRPPGGRSLQVIRQWAERAGLKYQAGK